MESLYAKYIQEREDGLIVENDFGFATYKIISDGVYIQDIYVLPDKRKSGVAKALADQVCLIAKEKNLKLVFGSVDVRANHATDSMKVLIAYGMSVHSVAGNLIYFSKSIEGE